MPKKGFEPTIPVFERVKTIHALDRVATVIGRSGDIAPQFSTSTLDGEWFSFRLRSLYLRGNSLGETIVVCGDSRTENIHRLHSVLFTVHIITTALSKVNRMQGKTIYLYVCASNKLQCQLCEQCNAHTAQYLGCSTVLYLFWVNLTRRLQIQGYVASGGWMTGH
jgi:hypothetical protein